MVLIVHLDSLLSRTITLGELRRSITGIDWLLRSMVVETVMKLGRSRIPPDCLLGSGKGGTTVDVLEESRRNGILVD